MIGYMHRPAWTNRYIISCDDEMAGTRGRSFEMSFAELSIILSDIHLSQEKQMRIKVLSCPSG